MKTRTLQLETGSDANNDLHVNIADAVWIVSDLFRGGPPTLCKAAADCNNDVTTATLLHSPSEDEP